jgi:hypothetical protein
MDEGEHSAKKVKVDDSESVVVTAETMAVVMETEETTMEAQGLVNLYDDQLETDEEDGDFDSDDAEHAAHTAEMDAADDSELDFLDNASDSSIEAPERNIVLYLRKQRQQGTKPLSVLRRLGYSIGNVCVINFHPFFLLRSSVSNTLVRAFV